MDFVINSLLCACGRRESAGFLLIVWFNSFMWSCHGSYLY